MDIECIGDDFEEMQDLFEDMAREDAIAAEAATYADALAGMSTTERRIHFAYDENVSCPAINDMVACRYNPETEFIGVVTGVDVMARDGITVYVDCPNPVDFISNGVVIAERDGFAIESSMKSNGLTGFFPVEAL